MKLLFVNGCISQRGEESRTLVLARSFLDAWQARHPEAEVETVEPEALLALKPFCAGDAERPGRPGRGSGASMRRCMIWPASSGPRTGWWWRHPSGT